MNGGLPWLIKLNILSLIENKIYISNDEKEYIKTIIDNISYEECFFETSEEEILLKNNITKIKRDNNVIYNALERDKYKCFFDNNHITFSNKPDLIMLKDII